MFIEVPPALGLLCPLSAYKLSPCFTMSGFSLITLRANSDRPAGAESMSSPM